MLKHEYLICMDIYNRLKDNINGSVFTTIVNDTLFVKINARKRYKI